MDDSLVGDIHVYLCIELFVHLVLSVFTEFVGNCDKLLRRLSDSKGKYRL